MKIAILGTSNSVLKDGYVPVYTSIEYPNQVDNYSLGANSSQYGLFALDHYHILKNYNFIVTDFAVNDQAFLETGSLTEDELISQFYALMKKIKYSKCNHINLILFLEKYRNIDNFYVRKMQIDICRSLEIPYIDMWGIFKEMKINEDSRLFQDIAHISSFYSKHIAYVLKKKRESIINNKKSMIYNFKQLFHNVINKKLTDIEEKKYFSLSFSSYSDAVKKRGSALITNKCLCLDKIGKISLDNMKNYIVEGIFFRSTPKNAYVALKSEYGARNKVLSIKYDGFFMRSIREPLPIKQNIQIFAKPIKDAVLCKEDNNQRPVYNEDDNYCEIVGLLLSKFNNKKIPYFTKNSTISQYSLDIENYKKSFELYQKISMEEFNQFFPLKDIDAAFITASLLNDRHKAKKIMESIVAMQGDNPYYLAALGEVHEYLGNMEQSECTLKQACVMAPSLNIFKIKLFNVTMKTKKYEAAYAIMAEAVAQKDDDPSLYLNLGNALLAMDRLVEAETAFTSALELAPENAWVYMRLAILNSKRQCWEMAFHYAQKAISFRKDVAFLYYQFGSIASGAGKRDTARGAYKRAMELEPQNKKYSAAYQSAMQ